MFHKKSKAPKISGRPSLLEGHPEPVKTLETVLGAVPIAIYTKQGLRVVWNFDGEWIDRLPRTWDGEDGWRIEVIYQDQAHAAVGATLEECVAYLLGGVLNIRLPSSATK